jgi:ribulose kinase
MFSCNGCGTPVDIKAQAEVLTLGLQESRQAAVTAAEEATAAEEKLQEAQVRATLPRSLHQHYSNMLQQQPQP